MKELSNVLTAVFTGISAVATVFATWIALRLYRKGLREDRPIYVVYTRFKSKKRDDARGFVVNFTLYIKNAGKVPFHVVDWIPLDPSDELDVAPSVCHKDLAPRATICGKAVLHARKDPEPLRVRVVLDDQLPVDVDVIDRTYDGSASKGGNKAPVTRPIVR